MNRVVLFVSVLALLVLVAGGGAQDTDEDCEAYVTDLTADIERLPNRMQSWVYSPSSLGSDFIEWVELRWEWGDREVPECVIPIHANVINMFAHITDAAGYAMAMKLSPGGSRLRRFNESIVRFDTLQHQIESDLSDIIGEPVSFDFDIYSSWGLTLDRMEREAG